MSYSPTSFKESRLEGVGIDLVSVRRARSFVKTHGFRRTTRLLTPTEKRTNVKKRNRVLDFAKRFAAKEAYFKSLGASWMGVQGFAALEIKLLSSGRFKVRPQGSFFKNASEADGCFFETRDYVGAHVIRWRPCS